MQSWITVTNNAGTTSGDGPIISHRYWEQTARLDKAGAFRFEMPCADPRAALVIRDYRAKCYGILAGTVTLLGEGLIQNIELQANVPGEETLIVSGPDMLHELTWRGMEGTVCKTDSAGHSPDAAKKHDGVNDIDYPNWIDGNPATSSPVTLTTSEWIYLGYVRPFKDVAFDFGATRNVIASTMTVQYYNGDEWIQVSNFSDGTESPPGTTWGIDGTMTFDMPEDWYLLSHDEERRFWLRMFPSANLTANVIINEITVTIDGKAADALSTIIAKAPAGWSLDVVNGYAEAQNSAYLAFSNETVLAALRKLAETTGEHFRVGAGRKVVWIQDDQNASGYRAIRGDVDASAFDYNDEAALILQLRQQADAHETATRIYPYGAGLGRARVDLSLADQAMPANYTLEAASNYIVYKPGGTEPTPRKDAYITWSDIRDDSARDAQSVTASNLLAMRALEWLQNHVTPVTTYDIQVAKLAGIVYPGDTVRVLYRHIVGSYQAVNINRDLVVLEATRRIDANGVHTVDMRLSTTDAWAMTDRELVADGLSGMWSGRAGLQPVMQQ